MSRKFAMGKSKSRSPSSSVDDVGPTWHHGDIQQASEETHSTDWSWKFHLKITVFLLVYTSVGAWIFQLLERGAEVDRMEYHKSALSAGRLKLLTTISKMNANVPGTEEAQTNSQWNESVLEALSEYESAVDAVFDGPVSLKRFLNDTVELKFGWSNYLHVYFFVTTLLSTIGYGNIVPRTTGGRIFCVFYAMIGIPVFLVGIAQAGKIFARFSVCVLVRICGRRVGNTYFAPDNSRHRKIVGASISIFGVIALLFLYMSIGAVLIDQTESWGFINSFYFCFITLTTVGFGDLVPLRGLDPEHLKASQPPLLLLFIRSLYTIFGLAITSTAIALVQKHYAEVWAKSDENEKDKKMKELMAQLSLFKGMERTKIFAGSRKCADKRAQFTQKPRNINLLN